LQEGNAISSWQAISHFKTKKVNISMTDEKKATYHEE